jgi:hypothetical protein
MSNDLKAFLLSAGGLLAVAGSGLLALWVWAGGLAWLD